MIGNVKTTIVLAAALVLHAVTITNAPINNDNANMNLFMVLLRIRFEILTIRSTNFYAQTILLCARFCHRCMFCRNWFRVEYPAHD